MARPPGPGRCVHCLKHSQVRTWDHVFPKAWYPDSTPKNLEKWQIPSCKPCNKDFGKLKEELLVRVGLCRNPSEQESLGIPQKALRAIDPKFGKSAKDKHRREGKRKKIIREMVFGNQIPNQARYPGLGDPQGILRHEQVAIPVKEDYIKRLTEKIVRGIFYIEDQQFIEPPYAISVFALSDQGALPLVQLLDQFGLEYAKGPGVTIRRAVTPEDNTSAVFKIEIWGRFEMYGTVVEADA